MVNKRKMKNIETSPPAITIRTLNPRTAFGWKRFGETTNEVNINIINDTDYKDMKYDNYYDNNETDENTYFDNTTKID